MVFVEMPIWEAGSRLLIAAALGMVVGFEREFRHKPAGIRTHMLVATGSAAFMILTLELALGPLKVIDQASADPTRIIQGIIGGIGFLGAGAIIQGRRIHLGCRGYRDRERHRVCGFRGTAHGDRGGDRLCYRPSRRYDHGSRRKIDQRRTAGEGTR